MAPPSRPETFHWSDCRARLQSLADGHPLVLEERGRFFEAEGLRVTPPLVFPIPPDMLRQAAPAQTAEESAARRARKLADRPGTEPLHLQRYLDRLPEEPGLQCLILLQAGSAALGMFEGGEVLATRTLKRYVVRGKGHAQGTHLATKGKSRYGSRLRLMNARRLLEEINEKLVEYWDRFGAPEEIFVNAPKGLWPELFRAKTLPPFDAESPVLRVPFDLPVPRSEVLKRAYKQLGWGSLERR